MLRSPVATVAKGRTPTAARALTPSGLLGALFFRFCSFSCFLFARRAALHIDLLLIVVITPTAMGGQGGGPVKRFMRPSGAGAAEVMHLPERARASPPSSIRERWIAPCAPYFLHCVYVLKILTTASSGTLFCVRAASAMALALEPEAR